MKVAALASRAMSIIDPPGCISGVVPMISTPEAAARPSEVRAEPSKIPVSPDV